jgi:HEAT repeat protein
MSAAWLIAALLGPDEPLFGLLRDPDARVAVSAVDAAAPFLTAEEFARLRKKEDGQDEWRGRYVVLANVARQLRHADLEVRRAAALALAPSAQENQAALFERALQDGDWFVRFAAFKGLSYISPTAALKVITDSGIDQAAENEPNRRVLLRIQNAARPAEKPGGQP